MEPEGLRDELNDNLWEEFLSNEDMFFQEKYIPCGPLFSNPQLNSKEVRIEETNRKKRKREDSSSPLIDASKSNAMELFEEKDSLTWKHILYNLLVEHHNNPTDESLLKPVRIEFNGKMREGFRVRQHKDSENRLTELYANYVW